MRDLVHYNEKELRMRLEKWTLVEESILHQKSRGAVVEIRGF